MRLDRLLEIVIILLNRRTITARELADRFEVSIRTIYRDIEAINTAGIPVISFQGQGGGFSIMEGYTVDRRVLSLDDMRSILTALKGLQSSLQNEEINKAIEKISSLIPDDRAEEFSRKMEMLVVEMTPWGLPGKRKDNVRILHRAITESRLLEFQYRNQKGEFSERRVEPMTLLLKGQTWYLFGYCLKREAYRIFRLSRIRNPELLLRGFTRRDASYKDYANLDAPPESVKTVDIRLRFDPEVRTQVEDYFDEEDIAYLENGRMEVTVSFPEGDWIAAIILRYGPFVEVIEPPAVRDLIRDQAKKILEKYQT